MSCQRQNVGIGLFKEKSRRDGILLTGGFNLRLMILNLIQDRPFGTSYCRLTDDLTLIQCDFLIRNS